MANAKVSTRFDWAAVSVTTARALLRAAYDGDPDLARRAEALEGERLAAQLRAVYGSPPQPSKLEQRAAWVVLHREWALKEANDEQLATLVSYAMAGLPVRERLDKCSSHANLRRFTRDRRLTPAFKSNLRTAFVHAHKRAMPASAGRRLDRSRLSGPVDLQGKDRPVGRDTYPHKIQAAKALDDLMAGDSIDERSGLIVLPTGAGKTSTMVDWLVRRMASDPDMRVLWLAHQHELLQQAARAFEAAAAGQSKRFSRKLRVISSAGSTKSTLVEADLDVALVTWQSLNQGWTEQVGRVRQFLCRPTVVVVDEAHHAAAAAYQRMLTEIRKHPGVALIGLTATPWPTQEDAGRRLRKTFPLDVLVRTAKDMHGQGILATPVFHTVDTGQHLELTPLELAKSKNDLPPTVLTQLANDGRDDLLVRTWTATPKQWGKTLVFATSRDHADRLGERLDAAGARVKVIHSTSSLRLGEALAWFRQVRHPAVLVSVGMLTEGVDMPDARTAFLARPTASRILMRQMMGRVLRGERAGGEATGNIVYFRDQWTNFDEVVEPGEIVGIEGRVATSPDSGPAQRLPPILDSSGNVTIPEDVLAQIRRMYRTRLSALPLGPVITTTTLVGYYALDDLNVPVMEHQRDAYQEVVDRVLKNRGFVGTPALSIFDSDPPPYPTQHAVRHVVNHVRKYGSAPAFIAIKAHVSSLAVARKLRKAPPMDDSARDEWLRHEFESTLARLSYESFEHFEEAVDQALREIRRSLRGGGFDPENIPRRRPGKSLPKLSRSSSRSLPPVRAIADAMQYHLAGEAALERLDLRDLPELAWTLRIGSKNWPATWAHWTLKNTGQLKGQGVIRVHRALRAPRSQVSDEVLAFLVFHEMLHHLLPGQGHSAEFLRLEQRWPDVDAIELELDTLHERFRLPSA